MDKTEAKKLLTCTVQQPSGKTREHYKVIVEWDSNDADYITETETFDKADFEDNLRLILALVVATTGKNGEHIDDNTDLEWVTDILSDVYLVAYSDWGMCHSIESVEIYYYDKQSIQHDVVLPSIDSSIIEELRALLDLENEEDDDE